MAAYKQVQKGPLKLKGKKKKDKDKAKLLETMGTNKKNEDEKRCGLDKILKKASKTHKQRVEDFNRHLDTLTEHSDIPSQLDEVASPPRVCSGVEEKWKAKLRFCLVPLVFSRNILLHTPLRFLLRQMLSKQCALLLELKVRLLFYSILVCW
ncbi:unnamed protein product [Nyctereutes procyonoides]|uniref:Protein FAM32A n=1 Tax=Nyctereutes procyonoides TaxID=34880 RepID=A0A811YSJ0_NYCPR|nr:unnamed protein product [Nyctereutes procyonoides]